MPVYYFTYHAYRNWRPDHPRGYTPKGKGVQPPDPEMASQYDRNAKQDAVTFDGETQRELLALMHSVCEDENWRLECVGFDPGHAHLVVSWPDEQEWEEVDRRLKNLLVLKMNRRHDTPGKRWFVRRHGTVKRVERQEHLDYLLETYIPDHPGLFWKRGMEVPKLDDK